MTPAFQTALAPSRHPDTEAIRAQTDIADIVSRYVPLEAGSGGRLKACCPFHSERTPSFFVYPDQHFKCFGCGRSGSVFDFVMLIENLSFAEAKLRLARNANFPDRPTDYRRLRFNEFHSPRDWRADIERSGQQPLLGTPGEIYLAKRGVDAVSAARAGVTFARSFFNHAAVCFPIRDGSDALVAMQGRYAGKSKWMRTVGPKKLGVFATAGAWEANQLAIVEAPIDALSFAQIYGIPAIALCGSSKIPDWVFKRLGKGVQLILAGDNDAAGDAAGDVWEAQCRGARRALRRMRPRAKDWNADLLNRRPVESAPASTRRRWARFEVGR